MPNIHTYFIVFNTVKSSVNHENSIKKKFNCNYTVLQVSSVRLLCIRVRGTTIEYKVSQACWIHFFCHDGAGYLRIRRSHSAHTSQLLENRRNCFYYYTACMRSQSVTPPLDLILPRTKPCLQNYLIKCEI